MTELRLLDHVCRSCMGRLLGHGHGPDLVVRCAECGATGPGPVDAHCWCGVEIAGHGRPFECFPNPLRRPDRPQEILVREKPQ